MIAPSRHGRTRWAWFRWIAGPALAALCSVAAHAASVLDFPRLSLEAGGITGAAIVNPTAEAASVTITAFASDGSVLAVREESIPAGRQLAMIAEDLFGAGLQPGQAAWFQAFSMTNGLTGFFLVFNQQETEFDGADLPPRARRIVFDQIRAGDGFSTELNVVNTGGEAVEAQLTLAVAGEAPTIRSLALAARGVARLDVAELFERESVPAGAYVTAGADQDLVGFELVRSSEGDIQGLNARNALEFLNTLYFPQISVLGPLETRLGLVNLSPQAVIVSVTAHGPDGTLFVEEVRNNPVALSLAPGESLDRDLVELFGFQGGQALEGWLEVVSTSPAINGYVALRNPARGAAATLTPVAQGSRFSIFSHLATARGFFTGLALLNPGSLPSDVRVVAVSAGGELLGTFDTLLSPGQRISRMITDVIPQADGQAGGLLLVRSSVPIFASALFGLDRETVLSNIPAQQSSALEAFRPDAALPTPSVSPRFALLQTGATQTFRSEGLGAGVAWRVNGQSPGTPASGSITSTGVFTAPASPPEALPVVISAVAGERTAGGSADVVSLQEILSGAGPVQALAYLNGQQRLYTAELAAVGAFSAARRPASVPAQELGTAVFSISPEGQRTPVATLDGEEIPSMIPFEARDGREYLLLAARASGRVLRLNWQTGAVRAVATGLQSPSALVLDPIGGSLLVAESTRVSSVPRSALESDLPQTAQARTARKFQPDGIRQGLASPMGDVAGFAVDACTGRLYLASPEGNLIEYQRDTGSFATVLEGLDQPGQVAAFYRSGVSCPDAFQLLVVERGADQVTLFSPASGLLVRPWMSGIDSDALALLPDGNPFAGSVAFDVPRDDAGDSLLSLNLPGLYRESPINPPLLEVVPFQVSGSGPDLSLSVSTAQAGGAASVNVFYRPGPEDGQSGGDDDVNVMAFRIGYDASRLLFEASDANGDGLPDSIVPNAGADFRVIAVVDPERPGEIGVFIFDAVAPLAELAEGVILSLNFTAAAGNPGTAPVVFSSSFPPSALDSQGNPITFDEIANGAVSVLP